MAKPGGKVFIVMSKYGEVLMHDPAPRKKAGALKTSLGVHRYCSGEVELIPISEDFNAVVCNRCKARHVIPKSITTYDQLDEHFKRKLSDASTST